MKRSHFVGQFRSCDAVRVDGVLDDRVQLLMAAGLSRSRMRSLCISASSIPSIDPRLIHAIEDAPRLRTIELSGAASESKRIVAAAARKAVNLKVDAMSSELMDAFAVCSLETLDVRIDKIGVTEFIYALHENRSISTFIIRLAKAWSCVQPLFVELAARRTIRSVRIVLDSGAVQSSDFTHALAALALDLPLYCTLDIEGYTNARIEYELDWRARRIAAAGPSIRACWPLESREDEAGETLVREIESTQIEG